MVTCKKCGNVFNEEFGICPKCGERYVAESAVRDGVPAEPKVVNLQNKGQAKEKAAGKKGRKGKIIAVIAIIAVVLIGAVISLILIFSGGSTQAQAKEQISLGEKYLQDEDFDEAIVAFRKAIDIDPNNADAYVKLAEAYRAVGNYSEAVKVLQKGYDRIKSPQLQSELEKYGAKAGLDALIDGAAAVESGSCGDNLNYTVYDNGVTVIEGDGRLEDTDKNNVIWRSKKVTEVYLKEGVSEIGKYAFRDCDTITTVHIPRSVVSIGEWAFNDSDRLTSIEVDPDNNYYSSEDGVLYNKDRTVLEQYPSGKWGTYTLPMSVTEVRSWAFAGASYLRYISVAGGNEIYSSYDGVLYTKDAVELVCYPAARQERSGNYMIQESAATIKAHAFYKVVDLEAITVPESVSYVEFHAFEKLTVDQSIYIKGKYSDPNSWDSDWNYKCKAEIVWDEPKTEESSQGLSLY